MKALVAGVALALIAVSTASAQSDHYVSGYTKADGTYVQPHMQTNPNATRADNYSTQGNVNPYTGQAGTKPLTPPPTYTYSPPPPPAPNPYAPPKTCYYGQRC